MTDRKGPVEILGSEYCGTVDLIKEFSPLMERIENECKVYGPYEISFEHIEWLDDRSKMEEVLKAEIYEWAEFREVILPASTMPLGEYWIEAKSLVSSNEGIKEEKEKPHARPSEQPSDEQVDAELNGGSTFVTASINVTTE